MCRYNLMHQNRRSRVSLASLILTHKNLDVNKQCSRKSYQRSRATRSLLRGNIPTINQKMANQPHIRMPYVFTNDLPLFSLHAIFLSFRFSFSLLVFHLPQLLHLTSANDYSSSGKLAHSLQACNERSRSISPETPPRPRRVLSRVASLPAGVARGKVGEFVAKHERGIPNPATGRDRPVRIVRQYAMVDKGT